MKKVLLTLFGVAGIGIFLFFYKASGGFGEELLPPEHATYVKPVPENWDSYKAENTKAIAQHIAQRKKAFDGFGLFAVSETDGIPLIVLKLLPVLAPEFWGDEDNFLSAIGLFWDDRIAGYPFPRGIGFSGLVREEEHGNIDYASFTCGGCHVGRVRLEDGSYQLLDGGVNSQFDIIGYRLRITQTLNKIYRGETDSEKKKQRLIDAFLTALVEIEKQDPNYFYNDYQYSGRKYDAVYEQAQIALFKSRAETLIPDFAAHAEQVYRGWGILTDLLYPEIKEDIMRGFPGMEDAISFNTVDAYFALKKTPVIGVLGPIIFPPKAGVTDIMVIWEQETRNPDWNEDKTNLINGGGQWNGHIPMPIYKNLAAQRTLGFDNVDIRVSAFSEDLMNKLPAPAYPFSVDIALAKQGETLFGENCAECHQPNNGKVYQNIGTDMGRAVVADTLVTIGAQAGFTALDVCSPETEVIMEGKVRRPCAEYKGVSLKNKSYLAMTAPKQHDGYNALPLIGLWAQAPYLHNGSVPTLYHMLMPEERPDTFIKSRLDYDQELVGFSWDPGIPASTGEDEGYLFKPTTSDSISNKGHDKDIEMHGKIFKLDWSDDKTGALALLEYMKTM